MALGTPLRMQAGMDCLEPFRIHVDTALEEAKVSSLLIPRVELALEEVLMNIISHAYVETTGDAQVLLDRAKNSKRPGLILEVKDWGPAFNPLEAGEPSMETDPLRRDPGGLGIHFLKHMTNGLEYRREDDTNIISILFYT